MRYSSPVCKILTSPKAKKLPKNPDLDIIFEQLYEQLDRIIPTNTASKSHMEDISNARWKIHQKIASLEIEERRKFEELNPEWCKYWFG